MYNRPSSPNNSMSSDRSESSGTHFDTYGYESDTDTHKLSAPCPHIHGSTLQSNSRVLELDKTQNINFAFLGTPSAGQTSILRRLAKEPIQLASRPTIGFDMSLMKLVGKNICLWDIPFSECFSSSYTHIKLKSPFQAIFFTATYYEPLKICTQISLWTRWLSRITHLSIPKILLLTKCDEKWDLDIDIFRSLALKEQITAIVEVDWCNVHRLEEIIKQLISKKFPMDRLSIYRYWG